MKDIVCAIHQPNFFPWMGYFDKIVRSDTFIFLDDVQIQKKASSYVSRTRLNCSGVEKWFTCPIVRNHGYTKVNDARFAKPDWLPDFMNVLANYYRDYTKCNEVIDFIAECSLRKNYTNIADYNIDIIKSLAEVMGSNVVFIKKSELSVNSSSTQMLIDLCKRAGASKYLCGAGASDYQNDELFHDQGIEIIYQDYSPVIYGDENKFIPGLSVIDYLITA
jgi:hypothetical protein